MPSPWTTRPTSCRCPAVSRASAHIPYPIACYDWSEQVLSAVYCNEEFGSILNLAPAEYLALTAPQPVVDGGRSSSKRETITACSSSSSREGTTPPWDIVARFGGRGRRPVPSCSTSSRVADRLSEPWLCLSTISTDISDASSDRIPGRDLRGPGGFGSERSASSTCSWMARPCRSAARKRRNCWPSWSIAEGRLRRLSKARP